MTIVTVYDLFNAEICTMILGFITRNKVKVIGTKLGAVTGFLYYYFVGCSNGSCMIASNPYVSTLYFTFLGYLVSGIIKK